VVAELLGGRLLAVRLKKSLVRRWRERFGSRRTFKAAPALSVKDSRPVSDMFG
jgi:hypothetical protein